MCPAVSIMKDTKAPPTFSDGPLGGLPTYPNSSYPRGSQYGAPYCLQTSRGGQSQRGAESASQDAGRTAQPRDALPPSPAARRRRRRGDEHGGCRRGRAPTGASVPPRLLQRDPPTPQVGVHPQCPRWGAGPGCGSAGVRTDARPRPPWRHGDGDSWSRPEEAVEARWQTEPTAEGTALRAEPEGSPAGLLPWSSSGVAHVP